MAKLEISQARMLLENILVIFLSLKSIIDGILLFGNTKDKLVYEMD